MEKDCCPDEGDPEQEDQADKIAHFIRTAKKHLCLTELTPAILNDLVKAVYVHAPDKSSRHRVQDVDISYNYIGILPMLLLNDLINGTLAWPKSCRMPKTT